MGTGQVSGPRGHTIVAVSVVFSVLAMITVFLRFIVRVKLGAGYYLDDGLIVLALVATLGVTINNIVGVFVAGIGDNEYYRTDPAAPGFPYPRELRPQGQVMFALQILHTCAMPLIKASVLAFYWRIFKERRPFRIAVWCVAIYIFCWWIGIFFATIFQCNPISDNWGTEPSQLGGCLPQIPKMYETAALTNMFSDLIILALPVPTVWGLHLMHKHKIAVMLIFMTGAIVVVAGIGRTVAYFSFRHLADYNFSHDYYALVVWTSLEPTLGVVGACLPTIRPLFQGFSPESVVNSIRSAFSLHSFRSARSSRAVAVGGVNGYTSPDRSLGSPPGNGQPGGGDSTRGLWERGADSHGYVTPPTNEPGNTVAASGRGSSPDEDVEAGLRGRSREQNVIHVRHDFETTYDGAS